MNTAGNEIAHTGLTLLKFTKVQKYFAEKHALITF